MFVASNPITETELATEFATVESDAKQFVGLVNGDWTSAAVRRRYFVLMIEAGATKRLDHVRGVHTFTFVDGSQLSVSRHGVTL